MPIWLWKLIFSIALKLGVPFLLKRFPWVPKEVLQILEELMSDLKLSKATKRTAYSRAKTKMRECSGGSGTACGEDLKKS